MGDLYNTGGYCISSAPRDRKTEATDKYGQTKAKCHAGNKETYNVKDDSL